MPTELDPTKYGDMAARLIEPRRLAELGPGAPNRAAQPLLSTLSPETLFAGHKLRDPRMAAACCAGLWLYHDYFAESHAISQDIDTPSGSFWHAILHRREPDFWNSKYWFRRVRQHPIYEPLHAAAAQAARRLPDSPAATALSAWTRWDPAAFVDLCEAAQAGQPDCEPLCREIQRCEWKLLFDYCYEQAVA